MDSAVEPWYNHGTFIIPFPLTWWLRMLTAPSRDWSVFQQIFADHWEAFQHAHPRYQTPYYDGLVAKMLACGNPEKIGYIEGSVSKVEMAMFTLPVQRHSG